MPDHEQAADEPRPDAQRPDGRFRPPLPTPPDGKQRARVTGVFVALVLALTLLNVLAAISPPRMVIPYSQFLTLVDHDGVKTAEVSSTDVTGVYQATGGEQPFATTRPPLADDTTLGAAAGAQGRPVHGLAPEPDRELLQQLRTRLAAAIRAARRAVGARLPPLRTGSRGDEPRPLTPQDLRPQGPPHHVRRRGRRRRGGRGAARGRRLPTPSRAVQALRRADPEGSAASRPAGDRQALWRGRLPARPAFPSSTCRARSSSSCSSGSAQPACANCSRRRRTRRRASCSSTSWTRSGKARGGAGPAAVGGHDEREQTLTQLLSEMDGFRLLRRRDHHGRHQPARGARPGAAASRTLRPPDRRGPPRSPRPGGDPRRPRPPRRALTRRRSRSRRGPHSRLRRRRARQRHQRGGAARRSARQARRSGSASSTRRSIGCRWASSAARA